MKTIFCVIVTSDRGPDLHEFETEKERLEWLAEQDDAFEDFYAFEVVGSIDGLTIPNVGKYAREELEEMDDDPQAFETVDESPASGEKLEWLVLPDEATARYTNWGNGRPGDASELVARVNANPALNQGHSDWRLPTIDELQTLMGTPDAPETDWYWTSSPYVGDSGYAWFVYSLNGNGLSYRGDGNHVRLVRASQ